VEAMICFSFDTDHMSSERMQEFLDSTDLPESATFFCTERYGCLERRQEFEAAPHPFLPPGGNWLGELEAKRSEFPNALGWRSHSCVFSHLLAEWIWWNGYAYASTHDDFGAPGLRPHRHLWGIWQMPIYYMDNLDFSRHRFAANASQTPFARSLIDTVVDVQGVYVFDFHPIHLMLNTPGPEFYFSVRDRFLQGEPVAALLYDGYGARSFFQDLLAAARASQSQTGTIVQAIERFSGAPVSGRDRADTTYIYDSRPLRTG
jgi:hypothetical protein